VVASLQDHDVVAFDEVHKPVFLVDAARPGAGQRMAEWCEDEPHRSSSCCCNLPTRACSRLSMKVRRGLSLFVLATYVVSIPASTSAGESQPASEPAVYWDLNELLQHSPAPWPSQHISDVLMQKYQDDPAFVGIYVDDPDGPRAASPDRAIGTIRRVRSRHCGHAFVAASPKSGATPFFEKLYVHEERDVKVLTALSLVSAMRVRVAATTDTRRILQRQVRLNNEQIDDLIERHMRGDRIHQLADGYGFHRTTVTHHLMSSWHHEPALVQQGDETVDVETRLTNN